MQGMDVSEPDSSKLTWSLSSKRSWELRYQTMYWCIIKYIIQTWMCVMFVTPASNHARHRRSRVGWLDVCRISVIAMLTGAQHINLRKHGLETCQAFFVQMHILVFMNCMFLKMQTRVIAWCGDRRVCSLLLEFFLTYKPGWLSCVCGRTAGTVCFDLQTYVYIMFLSILPFAANYASKEMIPTKHANI